MRWCSTNLDSCFMIPPFHFRASQCCVGWKEKKGKTEAQTWCIDDFRLQIQFPHKFTNRSSNSSSAHHSIDQTKSERTSRARKKCLNFTRAPRQFHLKIAWKCNRSFFFVFFYLTLSLHLFVLFYTYITANVWCRCRRFSFIWILWAWTPCNMMAPCKTESVNFLINDESCDCWGREENFVNLDREGRKQ